MAAAPPAAPVPAQLQPAGFPVSVRAASAVVGGHATDLIASRYADGTLLVVSQIGAFGTVVRARPDAPQAQGGGPSAAPTFSTQVLLGRRDEPLIALAARQLVELMASGGATGPLIVTLGLKDHTIAAVRELVAAVKAAGLLS